MRAGFFVQQNKGGEKDMESITHRAARGNGKPLRFLRSRKTTLIFILFFIGGVAFGSIYAVAGGNGSLLVSIVLNDLEIQAGRNLQQIFLKSVVQNVGILLYLYFCSNCSKGKPLIHMVPLFFGLSVGAVITAVLYKLSIAALPYVLACVALPKFIQALLLISACNNALKISAQLFKDPGDWRRTEGSCIHMGLYGGAFLLFSFLESIILIFFRRLLPL